MSKKEFLEKIKKLSYSRKVVAAARYIVKENPNSATAKYKLELLKSLIPILSKIYKNNWSV